MAVYITKDAKIEVRAPLRLSEQKIAAFIKEKDTWIRTHLSKVSSQLALQEEKKNAPVDKLLYFGKKLAVTYIQDGRTLSFDSEKFILPDLPFEELKPSVIDLYKKLLHPVIITRVQYFAALMNVSPSAVKINSAMKRWGSCSGKNALNFSWMLATVDMECLDYVVVHELAHISEHNHSARFWAIVAKTLPTYKSAEKKLKELHQQLSILFS
jgi:predicted metal-dependent hydrolase